MENQKQNKSAGTIVLVVLLLIVTVASLVLATYAWARYTTTKDGSAEAYVAEWDVDFSKGNSFTETFTYVAPTKLAPGTTGHFDMTVTSANTQVAYDYRVILSHLQNKPTNLHFYTKANKSADSEIQFTGLNGNEGTSYDFASNASAVSGSYDSLSGRIYGHVDLDASKKAAANKKITVYWDWPYQSTNTRTINGSTYNTNIPEYTYDRVLQQLTSYASRNDYTLPGPEDDTDAKKITALMKTIKEAEIPKATGTTTEEKSATAQAIVNKLVNDAIDTKDGEKSAANNDASAGNGTLMSLNVEFTAIQCDPTSGETEFTDYLLDDYAVNAQPAQPAQP